MAFSAEEAAALMGFGDDAAAAAPASASAGKRDDDSDGASGKPPMHHRRRPGPGEGKATEKTDGNEGDAGGKIDNTPDTYTKRVPLEMYTRFLAHCKEREFEEAIVLSKEILRLDPNDRVMQQYGPVLAASLELDEEDSDAPEDEDDEDEDDDDEEEEEEEEDDEGKFGGGASKNSRK